MTTILYSKEQRMIAADSQDTDGDRKTLGPKLFRLHKHVIATAGGSYAGLVFLQWFEKCGPDIDWTDRDGLSDLGIDRDDDFECLVIRPDGTAYTINRYLAPYEQDVSLPIGLGSGAGPALGAFYAGATVRQAVQIACKIDAMSSGPIKTMRT